MDNNQAQQEPVALVLSGALVKSELPENYTGHLYTSPPAKRTWVGLTDEEIKKIAKKHKWHDQNVAPHLMPVYRSLEAKLKEKNT